MCQSHGFGFGLRDTGLGLAAKVSGLGLVYEFGFRVFEIWVENCGLRFGLRMGLRFGLRYVG